ncbi:MAG: hypothetical protein ACI9AQ_002078, partial [Dinoroseobacter sp.]
MHSKETPFGFICINTILNSFMSSAAGIAPRLCFVHT